MEPDCTARLEDDRLLALRRRATAAGVPLHVSLALTHRCNLRCLHCYVLPNAGASESELSADDWLALAREAAAAGCFSMLLTGGEPLLRDDFAEIYLGIRRLGIYVSLFTNATRVNRRVVETLQAAPPTLIEVSLYGATPETYGRVTGSAAACAAAMRGIALMRAAGLPVRLKTVLIKETAPEFAAIRALAAPGEKPVRYDPAVHPRFAGDAKIEERHVPPAELAEMESRTVPELAAQWIKRQSEMQRQPEADSPYLYACGAGLHSCYVSADGMVQPCTSTVRYGVRYRRGGLLAAFRKGRAALRAKRMPADYECATCPDRLYCMICPAIADLESGNEAGKFAYACRLAHERSRKISGK